MRGGKLSGVSPSALAKLNPVLHRQFGVVTTSDAADCGVDRRRLTELLERGELLRLYRGVYAVSSYPDSWQRRWMSALLAAGAGAAISHRAAAWLHRLEHTRTGRRPDLEITVPRIRRSRDNGPTIHTATRITPDDIVPLGEWRVTTVAWTLCALARYLGIAGLERAVDAAIAHDRVTADELGATARRFRCCPGVPVIREVLWRLVPEVRFTRSAAERLFLRILVQYGLPLPEANVRVVDAAGNVRYLDFAYRDLRIAIEIDLHNSHLRAVGRNRDGKRQNALVPEWRPLRFDELDLAHAPHEVAADVRRALEAAGADLTAV